MRLRLWLLGASIFVMPAPARATEPETAREAPVTEGAAVPADVVGFLFYCIDNDVTAERRPRLFDEAGTELPTRLVATGGRRGVSPPEPLVELRAEGTVKVGKLRLTYRQCDDTTESRNFQVIAPTVRSTTPMSVSSTFVAGDQDPTCGVSGNGKNHALSFTVTLNGSWQPYRDHLELVEPSGERTRLVASSTSQLLLRRYVHCCGTRRTGPFGAEPSAYTMDGRIVLRGTNDGVPLRPVSGTLHACNVNEVTDEDRPPSEPTEGIVVKHQPGQTAGCSSARGVGGWPLAIAALWIVRRLRPRGRRPVR